MSFKLENSAIQIVISSISLGGCMIISEAEKSGGVNLRKSRKSRKFQGNRKKIYKMIVLILVH